ncbi:response regulator [Paraburkholderia sp. JPY432]|uniref:response regulator transcription factor n=1 Tax=Paraburkholderia youngii TaxID=2782701 RepID=UPI00159572E0|nr:response regulator [Paraburkholderia youngii]NVH75768.1 response regulator [Paraburkholderia youngii]
MSKAPVVAIVDDDPGVIESVSDLLESVGHRVCAFSSAVAFLESECFTQVGCLITDIDMPLIDGFRLRDMAHSSRPDLPVIIITGKSEFAGQRRVAELAPDRFFWKPFDSQALLMAIEAALDTAR